MTRPAVLLTLALAAGMPVPTRAAAQTIPIRTVPVATGDQFLMLPSATLGMGGVRLALDDSIADPWSNPAKGVLIGESAFLGSPTYYQIGKDEGAGRTFPVAGLFRGGTWYGGVSFALQQIDDGEGSVWGGWGCCATRTLDEAYSSNLYASGFAGRRLSDRWSAGLAVTTARLGAMDGVDLLYANAERIDQSGDMAELRVGAFRDGERDRLSLLLLHGRVSMEHHVSYLERLWDEDLMMTIPTRREELNEDQTRTWGGQVAWDRALEVEGWRIGASATINYSDHPKIPNYSIQNIPRDPGTTWAWEAAAGFSRSDARTTYALDLAFQPIWSETWQEADAQDVIDAAGRLSLGDRSIENDFFFTNVVMRSGLSHRIRNVEAQVGLEIHSFSYTLEQIDHVDRDFREQDEAWIEWTPTFGALFRLEALELRYTGMITTGTGRPGIAPDRFAGPGLQLLGDAILIAPDGPLTLQDAKVMTHQLSVRIPIRGR